MSKKPTISKEAQVLLKLLRIALGTEPRMYFGELVNPFPDDVNWKEVIRLSYEHKVSALAVDGLKLSGYDIYQGLNEQQAKELKTIVEPWFEDVAKTEQSYTYYVEVLKTLCQLFAANGLKTIILKGYGLSLNYPIPSHRGAGDIDIYLVDENNNQASEVGDRIITDAFGIAVEMDKIEHHTHFTFKGIVVENHYNLSVAQYKSESVNLLNSKLKSENVKNLIPITQINGAFIPSPDFNAMYLMRHICAHFHGFKNDLRQLCDWTMFLRSNIKPNWSDVFEFWSLSQMQDFANGINNFSVDSLDLKPELIPNRHPNSRESAIVLDTVFYELKHTGIRNFAYYFKTREKIDLVSDKHWLQLTLEHVLNHICKK